MRLSYPVIGLMVVGTGAANPLPDIPAINLTFPSTPFILRAHSYVQQHLSNNTLNHCVRSAYWALILAKKHPDFAGKSLRLDAVVYAAIMHDMGWTKNSSLISQDKRFEVDGANIARTYLEDHVSEMPGDFKDEAHLNQDTAQLIWDSIALHTTPSIANFKEPEVSLTAMGITVDGAGANFPGAMVTSDEYEAVAALFPRSGFKDEFIQTLCGLCKDKPTTTYDNIVGDFGVAFGLDGKGEGKERFKQERDQNQLLPKLVASLDALESGS